MYTSLLKAIFDGEVVTGQIHPETVTRVAQKYMHAVFGGYGKSFEAAYPGSTDYNVLSNLERNVYSFSGAKNFHETAALNQLLISNGNIRTFTDFRQEAEAIIGEYSRHTESEYNAAIAGAQMAAKWSDMEGQDPYLRYETVGDRRVRESHRQLDGVVKKKSDKFWNTYYPPNGWGCRCTVVELPGKATETPDERITYPQVQRMWQVNTAKENVIFPEGSQQLINAPRHIIAQALALLPYERRYVTVYENKLTGGVVKVHADAPIEKDDHKLHLTIAQEKADLGHHVEVLPKLDPPTNPRREKTLPGAYYGKNPDLRIDREYVEVKAPEARNKIVTRINQAAKQADIAIVDWHETYHMPRKTARNIFINNTALKRFEIRGRLGYTLYNRRDYE